MQSYRCPTSKCIEINLHQHCSRLVEKERVCFLYWNLLLDQWLTAANFSKTEKQKRKSSFPVMFPSTAARFAFSAYLAIFTLEAFKISGG